MKLSRRSFMKANAVAATAAAAGIKRARRCPRGNRSAKPSNGTKPVPFCGTGCSVLVGTQQRACCCMRSDRMRRLTVGLTASKVTSCRKSCTEKDRFNTDAAREERQISQRGEFTPISWDRAFDVMEEIQNVDERKGPESIGMFGSGQWTIWEGYAAAKLFKAVSV